MGRGAWWATVHGNARVGHNLATNPNSQQAYSRTTPSLLCVPMPVVNAESISC